MSGPDRILEVCRSRGFKDRREAGMHVKALLSAGTPARDVARKLGLTIEEARKLAVKAIEEPVVERSRSAAGGAPKRRTTLEVRP